MLQNLQLKNDELKRENHREVERRRMLEEQVNEMRSRADRQFSEQNERNTTLVERYDRKISDMDDNLAKANNEIRSLREANSRLE
jgi:chromosome segregation ATPase